MQQLNQIIDKLLTDIEENMTIDTQLQAYAAMKDKRAYWRNKLKSVLKAFPEGLTTEQACYYIKSGFEAVPPLKIDLNDIYKSLQPRTSEAHEDLQIFDTGKRRKNSSGKNAIVWRLVETEEERALAVKQTLKKIKPIGDKGMFGKMMQAKYAYAAEKNQLNAIKLNNALLEWGFGNAETIREKKFSKINEE